MSAAAAPARGNKAGSAAQGGGAPAKADLTAWLAVAAGSIGALMATLDISIVNSALPTIQGEIGASGTEGTWIATSYLVAEIIIIPLSAWLERLLGLRTFLLIASILFTALGGLRPVDQPDDDDHRTRGAGHHRRRADPDRADHSSPPGCRASSSRSARRFSASPPFWGPSWGR